MKRGELYCVSLGSKTDPKNQRVFAIISRPDFIGSDYSTVICAPVYTNYEGLSTQVPVGIEEGLKHQSAIRCDELMSVFKSKLTNYVGSLSEEKLIELGQALFIAVGLDEFYLSLLKIRE